MKSLSLALALLLFSVSAASAADPAVCTAAKTAFNRFIAAQPNTCTADAECGSFYYGPEPCDPPYVLATSHENAAFSAALKVQQDSVRAACDTQATTFPACSPIAAFPACVQGRCVNKTPR